MNVNVNVRPSEDVCVSAEVENLLRHSEVEGSVEIFGVSSMKSQSIMHVRDITRNVKTTHDTSSTLHA